MNINKSQLFLNAINMIFLAMLRVFRNLPFACCWILILTVYFIPTETFIEFLIEFKATTTEDQITFFALLLRMFLTFSIGISTCVSFFGFIANDLVNTGKPMSKYGIAEKKSLTKKGK